MTQPKNKISVGSNPWIAALGFSSMLFLFIGLLSLMSSGARAQIFGSVLMHMGGGLLAAWLLGGAICWQIVSRDTRR